MSAYKEKAVRSEDGLSIHYRDYGPEKRGLPLLCLHGLTRNSADFEPMAERLAGRHRLLAMDVRGRGRSDWDPNPENYHVGVYVADAWRLLAKEGIGRAAVVGTSMGGLMGMVMGSQKPDAVAGLVLNDIGPTLSREGLERIAGYVGKTAPAASWDEARAQVMALNEIAFPDLTQEDWDRFARRLYRESDDGAIVPDYDPAIAQSLVTGATVPPDLWPVFDALADIPLLVIRGASSDLLTAETMAEMKARRADLQTVEIANRGHAPLLDEPEALAAIKGFLARLEG